MSNKYTSLEHSIRNVVSGQITESVATGTQEREKQENVLRPHSNQRTLSNLERKASIKNKIIDEAMAAAVARITTGKKQKAKAGETVVDFKPDLHKEPVQEEKLPKNNVGTMTSHSGKAAGYDPSVEIEYSHNADHDDPQGLAKEFFSKKRAAEVKAKEEAEKEKQKGLKETNGCQTCIDGKCQCDTVQEGAIGDALKAVAKGAGKAVTAVDSGIGAVANGVKATGSAIGKAGAAVDDTINSVAPQTTKLIKDTGHAIKKGLGYLGYGRGNNYYSNDDDKPGATDQPDETKEKDDEVKHDDLKPDASAKKPFAPTSAPQSDAAKKAAGNKPKKIKESYANLVKDIIAEAATAAAAPVAAKVGGKLASKLIPGVGVALGAKDAYDRAQAGDNVGAAISGLSGAASTVPVVGTAAGLAGMGIQAARDKYRTGSYFPDNEEIKAAVDKEKAPAAPTSTTPPVSGTSSTQTAPKPAPAPAGAPVNTQLNPAGSSAAKKAPVTTSAGDGVTGKALAGQGIGMQDRRSQAYVDQQFGAGKYKAGSAASNLALLAKAKKDATLSAPVAKAAGAASGNADIDTKTQAIAAGASPAQAAQANRDAGKVMGTAVTPKDLGTTAAAAADRANDQADKSRADVASGKDTSLTGKVGAALTTSLSGKEEPPKPGEFGSQQAIEKERQAVAQQQAPQIADLNARAAEAQKASDANLAARNPTSPPPAAAPRRSGTLGGALGGTSLDLTSPQNKPAAPAPTPPPPPAPKPVEAPKPEPKPEPVQTEPQGTGFAGEDGAPTKKKKVSESALLMATHMFLQRFNK